VLPLTSSLHGVVRREAQGLTLTFIFSFVAAYNFTCSVAFYRLLSDATNALRCLLVFVPQDRVCPFEWGCVWSPCKILHSSQQSVMYWNMGWKAYFIIYLKLLAYLVPCLFLPMYFFKQDFFWCSFSGDVLRILSSVSIYNSDNNWYLPWYSFIWLLLYFYSWAQWSDLNRN